MPKELVSVISPCYNVAPYIGRYLDSLLCQTYKKLEIILVNDGSTDNTGDIIKAYIPRLEEQGYKVIYIEQENGGQSSAVNNALKLVSGKFLAWPDPDDWLTPDSIEKRVDFLQLHPDVGMVRSNIERIEEGTGRSLGFFEPRHSRPHPIKNAFKKLILCKTWFGAMACMIRMDFFDKVVPNREIYVEKSAGQNWQMMLPMTHAYSFWQLPDVLGYYCVRMDSHSHKHNDLESNLTYHKMSEDVLINTLNKVKAPSDTIELVRTEYLILRFRMICLSLPKSEQWEHLRKTVTLLSRKKDKLRVYSLFVLPCFVWKDSNIIWKICKKIYKAFSS